jgi:hypothetical protein
MTTYVNLPHVAPNDTATGMVTNAFFSPRHCEQNVIEQLQRNKEISMNCLSKKMRTPKFQRFANTDLMDRFLLSSGAYFEELFEGIGREREAEAARSPSPADSQDGQGGRGAGGGWRGAGGVEPSLMDTVMRDSLLDRSFELQVRQKQMALAYAAILLKEGRNYAQLHNEEQFFEALIEFTCRVVNTKFDRRYWDVVECELGRLWRSPGFNKAYRTREQPAEHLTARELWLRKQRQRVMWGGASPGGSTAWQPRVPLYGLTSSGRSPMVTSAFHRPRTPPSATFASSYGVGGGGGGGSRLGSSPRSGFRSPASSFGSGGRRGHSARSSLASSQGWRGGGGGGARRGLHPGSARHQPRPNTVSSSRGNAGVLRL